MRQRDTGKDEVTHEGTSLDDLSKLEVLSIEEFCRWAGISRASAYRCIKDGQLVAAKLRSRTIIRREDAVRFIAGLPLS